MNRIITGLKIIYKDDTAHDAARLFSEEIGLRSGEEPQIQSKETDCTAVCLNTDSEISDKDSFVISTDDNTILVRAGGKRGLIFGCALLLRKMTFDNDSIALICDVSGTYFPQKRVRGHQIGYRTTPNTYDAWDYAEYFRYYRDLMFCFSNTVEHIPYEDGHSRRNVLMKYDEQEFLPQASRMADGLDLDVSLWYPNSEDDLKTALANREKVFSSMDRLDALFIPGGDPGELDADEMIDRCSAIGGLLKKYHPQASVWPSDQMPRGLPGWGDRFLERMNAGPANIDGVITGPNRAFPIGTLRRRLSPRYPIRYYPDITHSLRCEHPVHTDGDEWDYALAACLSRESIDPRPVEFRALHSQIAPYTCGSVSYSEGINDDLNKFIWSDADYFGDSFPVRESVEDYARLFFPGHDARKVADAIFGLEQNWRGRPEESYSIPQVYEFWRSLGESDPGLFDSWRFVSFLFRSECDLYVRDRVIFEGGLTQRAQSLLKMGFLKEAKQVLLTSMPQEIADLREEIGSHAVTLYDLIGLQTDIKNFHADGWERGAVLETIDDPVTDRQWLLGRISEAEKMPDIGAKRLLAAAGRRNEVGSGEIYYSIALDGLKAAGCSQFKDWYLDFRGDRPSEKGEELPTALFTAYDHFSFRYIGGGLENDTDYHLLVTYIPADTHGTDFELRVNGNTVYQGECYGGERNTDYEKAFLPSGFTAVEYSIKKEYIINGCVDIRFLEKTRGIKICEFRLTKRSFKL